MIERCHIVTTVIKKEWEATRAKGQERAKHVAMILGDPAKPDALKPSCTFGDDFYTGDHTYDVGMRLPVIVNLNAGDSSYGITQRSIAHTFEDLSDVTNSLQ